MSQSGVKNSCRKNVLAAAAAVHVAVVVVMVVIEVVINMLVGVPGSLVSSWSGMRRETNRFSRSSVHTVQ